MNTSRKFLSITATLLACAAASQTQGLAQGCVAARGAGVCNLPGHAHMGDSGPWEGSVAYRWLRSDRHFTGDHEEPQRQAEGSEIINDSSFIDLGVTYHINPRYSVGLVVPFSTHDRSSTVVLNGVRQRFSTQASGIGDVRLEGHAWIFNPADTRKWNIQLGLGISAPTGEEDATDVFLRVTGTAPNQVLGAQERTVDQSIQPGTGGWGFSLDTLAYYQLLDRLTAFANGVYTITPEGKNGVPTFRTRPSEAIMSIADAYMGRVGLSYVLAPKYGLSFSLAGRIEGVPVWDAVGPSDGFRRPGFAISIEPGVSVMYHSWSFNVNTPVALYRNRERSVPDMQTSATQHGDAAFADFVVMAGISKRF